MSLESELPSPQPTSPGWLSLDDVARELSVDAKLIDRLIEARAVRFERRVVDGEVIVHLPSTEVSRLRSMLGAQSLPTASPARTVERGPLAATPVPAPRPEPAADTSETTQLWEAHVRSLEGQLGAVRAQLAESETQSNAAERAREGLQADNDVLTQRLEEHTGREEELESLRAELAEVLARCSVAEQSAIRVERLREELDGVRAELDECRRLLAESGARELGKDERLEASRRLEQELATCREELAEQAARIAAMERIEKNNERYLNRLEKLLEQHGLLPGDPR